MTTGRGGRGYAALREVLSAATLRAIMGLREAGQVFLARVGTTEAGEAVDTTGGADVLVHVLDALTDLPVLGRLFIPANMLWRKPAAGESVMVLEGREAGGAPGAPYVLHGDAGATDAVPPWFGTKSGLYTDGPVVVQSANGNVEVVRGSGGKVKLGAAGATKQVNRRGDPIEPGTLSVGIGTPVAAGPATTVPVTITYTPPTGPASTIVLNFTGVGLAIAPVGGTSITLGGRTAGGSENVLAED